MTEHIVLLAEWRRTIAEMYAQVRRDSPTHPELACRTFRAQRDVLFKHHAHSPLDDLQKMVFTGIPYYPYDPAWRVVGEVLPAPGAKFQVDVRKDGLVVYRRVARVAFTVGGTAVTINLYWIEGYGGGLFLPFKDETNKGSTYHNGRYLFDTIKGADLGTTAHTITLDFNYAYNPSCSYNPRWICPLAPAENELPFSVLAGERI